MEDTKESKSLDLDQLQEKFGGISTYQVMILSFTCLLPFGTGFMSQSSVFFSAIPEHRCAVPPIDDPNVYPNLTEENITDLTIPPGESCYRYAYNLSACTGENDFSCITDQSVGVMECDQGFHYDDTYYDETTVSEWDLLCGGETLDSLANSLYFFGVFLGSAIIGPLMDWFGRRRTALIMCISLIVSGIACAFSPSYEVYISLRVLVAASGIPCFIAYYTYASEISDSRRRPVMAAISQLTTGVSHTVLPGIAYFLRDWRYLCIAISLIPSTYLVIYFFIPNSPRWLLAQGREKEAKVVIQRYATSRKTVLNDEDWDLVVKTENEKLQDAAEKKYLISDLFRPRLMRLVSLNVMYIWFVVSMVFYGLTLNVGTLAGDPYVNAVLNALVEIIAYSAYYPVIRILGRKWTTSFSYLMGGFCCLCTMLLTELGNGNETAIEASRWIAIAGKMFASLSFAAAYQFTAELYPTVTRGTAMSMGSMAARVGSMIMPWTLQIQYSIPWLTQTIFGTLSVIAGLSSLLFPETKHCELMTTIDEAEDFYHREMKLLSKICGGQDRESIEHEVGKDNEAYTSFSTGYSASHVYDRDVTKL